jgi:hypothetical protein
MQGIPPGVGVVLTADHGVVDVPATGHIELADTTITRPKFVGGDTRNAYLYFNGAQEASEAQEVLRGELGELCWIYTPQELVESGWLGQLAAAAAARVPDLYVLARKKVAIYHRDFSSPKSYKMVGHHGSISPEELQIPLLRLGAWR